MTGSPPPPRNQVVPCLMPIAYQAFIVIVIVIVVIVIVVIVIVIVVIVIVAIVIESSSL